jgi:hypothetical protein
MAGDRVYNIFLAKTQLGWRERGISASASIGPGTVEAPAQTFTISITGD